MSAFRTLRDLIAGVSSPDEAKDNLIQLITLMSEINDHYLDVAVRKDQLTQDLQAMVAKAQTKHNEIEEKIHECQVKADSNMCLVPEEFNPNGIPLLPLEELDPEDSEISNLEGRSEEYRKEYILRRNHKEIETYQQRLKEVEERKCELVKELDRARSVFGPYIVKMKNMHEQVLKFQKKD